MVQNEATIARLLEGDPAIRWQTKRDLPRGLDHFQATDAPWDDRYGDALDVLVARRSSAQGRYLAGAGREAVHVGQEPVLAESVLTPRRGRTGPFGRSIRPYSSIFRRNTAMASATDAPV